MCQLPTTFQGAAAYESFVDASIPNKQGIFKDFCPQGYGCIGESVQQDINGQRTEVQGPRCIFNL